MGQDTTSDARTPGRAAIGVNGKAIWALGLAVLLSPVGVVLGHLARAEIRRTGERGDALAKTALGIGYPLVVLWVTFWINLLLAIVLMD